MSVYRFPAIADYKNLTRDEQFMKIVEEVKEVKLAKFKLSNALKSPDASIKPISELRDAFGIELLDAKHAIETALRREFSENEVEELTAKVIEKNARRGYYEVTK